MVKNIKTKMSLYDVVIELISLYGIQENEF